MRSVALIALLLSTDSSSPGAGRRRGRSDQDMFTSRVRPILARHCFKCHGPDDKARKAKLRLDVRSQAVKPAASGAIAIVPGKPDESELVQPDLRRRCERANATRRGQGPTLRAR